MSTRDKTEPPLIPKLMKRSREKEEPHSDSDQDKEETESATGVQFITETTCMLFPHREDHSPRTWAGLTEDCYPIRPQVLRMTIEHDDSEAARTARSLGKLVLRPAEHPFVLKGIGRAAFNADPSAAFRELVLRPDADASFKTACPLNEDHAAEIGDEDDEEVRGKDTELVAALKEQLEDSFRFGWSDTFAWVVEVRAGWTKDGIMVGVFYVNLND